MVLCPHSKKRRECKGLDEQPYVKKPPNAFMLFMREHRAKVAAEHSAAANAVLGLMVTVFVQTSSQFDQRFVGFLGSCIGNINNLHPPI